MATNNSATAQQFKPRMDVPRHQQFTIAVLALRKRADDKGVFGGDPPASQTILEALVHFGGNDANARRIQRHLVHYGLLTIDGTGKERVYTVNMSYPTITEELLRELRSKVRKPRADKKQVTAPVSTNGASEESSLEGQLAQLVELTEGFELALAEIAQERNDALAKLQQAEEKSADLQRQLQEAKARVVELERERQAVSKSAAAILQRWKPST